ncbi:MAG: phospho-N-acetylmuramoyl-pentapeptide-transferase, partial [Hyphomicrobiales bacterium]
MLYYLLTSFTSEISALNVFRYITTRTGGAILTALVFIFIFGPRIISLLKVKQGKGQPIRTDGPQRHIVEKQGTPTMGGLMILSGVFVSTILWADLSNLSVWGVLFVTLGFGAIGFYDDFLKVTRASVRGFSSRLRLFAEFAIAAIAVGLFMWDGDKPLSCSLAVPFL